MKKIVYCAAVLLVLACGLSSCGQVKEDPAPEMGSIYAVSDNYFNLEQTHEWKELGTLLQGLSTLAADSPYDLGVLMGHVESLCTRVSADQALDLSVPDEVTDQLMPEDLAEAYEVYDQAKSAFLTALQKAPAALTDPDSAFRAALPSLVQGLEEIDLTLRQTRAWEDDPAWMQQYIKDLGDFAQQLEAAAALLNSDEEESQ